MGTGASPGLRESPTRPGRHATAGLLGRDAERTPGVAAPALQRGLGPVSGERIMMASNGNPGREALCEMHAVMARIKACDDQLRTAIARGRLPMLHFSVRGQEAIPAGMSQALRPSDLLVSTYRGMHDAIGKGASMPRL